ncbi:MAG: hypothetical protein L0Y68_03855 [Candidatus Dadabacteria bacterium]|nr:hypothetical protein [Candidatus Dadabacteria bacterium]
MFIYRLIQALKRRKVNYAIAGGYAVALHGAVRGTVDIDLVIRLSKKNFLAADAALKDLDLQSKLPLQAAEVYDFRQEYISNKNLIAWNFINFNNPMESVDIIITEDLRNMKVKRILVGDKILRLVSIEDLIKMKKRSRRPQDLEDIKALRSLKE